MDSLIKDIRFGMRWLMKRPTFTAIAVVTLALGIGANSAIFSVVNAVLFRPLLFKDPDRLMVVWERRENSIANCRLPIERTDAPKTFPAKSVAGHRASNRQSAIGNEFNRQ